jgi:hypothetical protein
MELFAYLLHHSESIDPTLVDWIRHEIDSILGFGPVTIVALLGALIVAFPVALLFAARREARSGGQSDVAGARASLGAARRSRLQ